MTLIDLLAFPIIGLWARTELTLVSRKKDPSSSCHHRGKSTVLLQPLCDTPCVTKRTHPFRVIDDDTNRSMTLRFKIVHVSVRERLYACLRSKLAHVSKNVQQRSLGSHISVGRRVRRNTWRHTHGHDSYDQSYRENRVATMEVLI